MSRVPNRRPSWPAIVWLLGVFCVSSVSSFNIRPRVAVQQERYALRLMKQKGGATMLSPSSDITKAISEVPAKLAKPLLDRADESYLKKCLFLPPPGNNASQTDAVVIWYPGIGMPPYTYQGISAVIQDIASRQHGLNLYIVLIKFFNNLGYLPDEPKRRLESVLTELRGQGVPTNQVVVVGHSGGAFLSYDTALTKSQAFIHLGSTLNSRGVLPWKPRSLTEYPKPLLTLLGEMDGYIRLTGGALEYAEVEELRRKKGFEDVMLEKPVLILPGVSHEQFGDGTQSKLAKMSGRKDLAPYVALKEAWVKAASIISAFLAIHIGQGKATSLAEAEKLIRNTYADTGEIVKPFLEALHPKSEEDFVRWAQAELVHLDGFTADDVSVSTYTSELEFMYSKSSFNKGSVQVPLYRNQDKPVKIAFTKQVAPALALKMKRQEAVAQALGRQATQLPSSARELNIRTFAKALASVSEAARERYERYGRKLVFLDDEEVTVEPKGPRWVQAPLQVKPRADEPMTVEVRSPVLYTPLDTVPRFAGMCYMKLLSPAQAVEWILHDAFIPV